MKPGKNRSSKNAADRRWIEIGADLDAMLVPAKKSDVATILHEAADRYGLAVRTLQVIAKAYRFVQSHAKSVGMDVGDVSAAFMSVDVLMRIEKKSPSTALNIRKSVFKGEYSYRDMIAIEHDLNDKEALPEFKQVDWNAFAQEFFNDYFLGGELTFVFGPERKPYSLIANLLGVDLEVSHAGKTACLFITPRVVFSAHRGQELEHQIPKVLASVGFYDKVIYLLWDDDEISVVDRLLKRSDRGIFAAITLLPRVEVSAYYCFGDEVLAPGMQRSKTK